MALTLPHTFYNASPLHHPRLYSLQSALGEATFATVPTRIPLYSAWWENGQPRGGCFVEELGRENCNVTCRNSSRFFSEATTIHNCAVFWRLQELGYTMQSVDDPQNANITTAIDMTMLTQKHITNSTDGFTDHQYFPGLSPISHCLDRTCNAVKDQYCAPLGVPLIEGLLPYEDSTHPAYYFDICNDTIGISDKHFNSDVGGIGVSAYILSLETLY